MFAEKMKSSLKKFVFTTAVMSSIALPAFAATQLRNSDLLAPEEAHYHSKIGDVAAIALGVLAGAIADDRRGDGRRDDDRGGPGRGGPDRGGPPDRGGFPDDRGGYPDRGGPGRGPDHGPGRGGPGRGGPGRWPDRDRTAFACYAENGRRQTFVAVDRDPRYAQDEAIRSCYRESRRCRPMGCREVRR